MFKRKLSWWKRCRDGCGDSEEHLEGLGLRKKMKCINTDGTTSQAVRNKAKDGTKHI